MDLVVEAKAKTAAARAILDARVHMVTDKAEAARKRAEYAAAASLLSVREGFTIARALVHEVNVSLDNQRNSDVPPILKKLLNDIMAQQLMADDQRDSFMERGLTAECATFDARSTGLSRALAIVHEMLQEMV